MNPVERLGWTLVHFLWQGTLIAAVYAVARKRPDPRVRYGIGLMGLVAMLAAPIVTFVLSGPAILASDNHFVGLIPASSAAVETGSGLPGVVAGVVTPIWSDNILPWLVLAWCGGVIIFWARLAGGWIVAARMRSVLVRPASMEWQRTLDELRSRLRISRPVKLLISALVQVPTVVGWLRPVVLMPVGALAGIPADHVEALLAHELAHIRRHDYLVNILQSVAEAMLFYHPAVWWISNHIRSERELCCDDVAVAISGDAFGYAHALTGLEANRARHFVPALAANGGSLAERIARLLGVNLSRSSRGSGSAIFAVGALIAITAVATVAQTPAPTLSFEVASIKLSPPEYVGFQTYVKGDRYTAMTATVRNLLSFAYGLRDFQISGGPAWSGSTAYNVSATMAPAAKPADAKLMMQTLLADRFGLRFHRVTKERAGFAMVIDSNGPKMTVSANPGPGLGLGRGNLNGRGANTMILAQELSSQLEAPVADRTGLTALYDFRLTWSPDIQAAESAGPSLFTSIREQLGLRLDAVKDIPVEFLVIDQVKTPTEN